jgi:hypothetical protein
MLTGRELLTLFIATRVRRITSIGRYRSSRNGLYLLWSAPLPNHTVNNNVNDTSSVLYLFPLIIGAGMLDQ